MSRVGGRILVMLSALVAWAGLTSAAHAECWKVTGHTDVAGIADNGWFVSHGYSSGESPVDCPGEVVDLHDENGETLVEWTLSDDEDASGKCTGWKLSGPRAKEFASLGDGKPSAKALVERLQMKAGANHKLAPDATPVKSHQQDDGSISFTVGKSTIYTTRTNANGSAVVGSPHLLGLPSSPLVFLHYRTRDGYCSGEESDVTIWLPRSRLTPSDPGHPAQ